MSRQTLRRATRAGALALALLALAGCTLVNSFEPLAQPMESGAPPPDPTKQGVVVIGGYRLSGDPTSPYDYVLTALNPTDGTELAHARRHDITVAAILYDGATDLWYVFESGVVGHIFALANEPFFVHALKIDPFTGEWTELSATAIPPAYSFSTSVMLTEHIAYVAYTSTGTLQLSVLDTSDPRAITVQGGLPIGPGIAPVALLGNPALGTVGSNQTVMLCWIARPSLMRASYIVPSAGDPMQQSQASVFQQTVGGSVGLTTILEKGAGAREVMAISSPANNAPANLSLSDITGASTEGPYQFPFTDSNVETPTFSTCHNTVFVSGTNVAKNVYAMSLAQLRNNAYATAGIGDLTSTMLNYSGQGLYYEPYTDTVIAPFDQGGSGDLTALHVTWADTGDPMAPVTRGDQPPLPWKQLTDVFTNFVATKAPANGCPN